MPRNVPKMHSEHSKFLFLAAVTEHGPSSHPSQTTESRKGFRPIRGRPPGQRQCNTECNTDETM